MLAVVSASFGIPKATAFIILDTCFDEYKYHDFLQARLRRKLVIEAWLNFVLIQTQRLKFRNVTAKKKNVVVTSKIKFCCHCHFAPVTSVAFVSPFFCHENVNMSFFSMIFLARTSLNNLFTDTFEHIQISGFLP